MIRKITERFTPKQYLVELVLGLIAIFGFYLIIAWSSYSPLDNAWSVSTYQTTTINKAGAFGAWFIDFFFTMFGHLGNIIPFALLGGALNGIRTKKIHNLTWTKVALRVFGFILLLCGLTSCSALLLNNSQDYLAGGVLGGFFLASLNPFIGKFGVLLFALIFSVVGFILCSGASLIRLLVRFYHWLTVKNVAEPAPVANQPAETMSETSPEMEPEQSKPNLVDISYFSQPNIRGLPLEPILPQTPPILDMQREENIANTNMLEKSAVEKTEEFSAPSTQDFFDADKFGNYAVDQAPELPSVSIQHAHQFAPEPISIQLPEQENNFAFNDLPMPKVSLDSPVYIAPQPAEPSPVRVEQVADIVQEVEDEEDLNNELARQFALQEQQRLQQMQERAKEIGAEQELKIMLNQADPEPELIIEEKPAQNKQYGDSLFHPFLQPKTVRRDKPTTPLPSLDLLDSRATEVRQITQEEIRETSQRIEQQLRNFNVKALVKGVLVGPVVTRYELELQPGVKASKVTGIDTDLARALMFRAIRVAEVIPGKPYIGIETPNAQRQTVPLRDVLDTEEFRNSKSLLAMALGKDISGKPVIVDLAKMPHLLVAGSTGSGKSVGVNTMILSLLFRVKPDQVKFIMIDPKVVELSVYNDIPHLLTEVVTDMKKAANALRWCVEEMERRYQLLSALRVRNIEGYNEKIDEAEAMGLPIPNPIWREGDTMDTVRPSLEKLSYIVVVVDEFADLMMVAGKQIEELIARLAQKARAIGIHLILATQRPSVDVITGLIKANVPSRIAFTVASKIDSRTILDQGGAESLLGLGDMLYSGPGTSDLVRVHGAFMTDDEVVRVADDWRARGKPEYIESILQSADDEADEDSKGGDSGELDDLFNEVMDFVINTGTTSTSSVQRRFKVGFNRAARIMDQLEEQGIVSAMQNGKREVLARRSDY